MKIAYIIVRGITNIGGIEKYTYEVAFRLAEKGHKVTIFSIAGYDNKIKDNRVDVISVPSIPTKSLEKFSATFLASIRLIFNPTLADIIHFHALGPSMWCFVPRLIGKKTIVQAHGIEWRRSKWGLFGRVFLRISEIPSIILSNAVTAVSKNQKRYIESLYNRKCIYIPTGINISKRQKPYLIKRFGLQGDDYILFCARIVKEKGLHYLIRAYNNLKTDKKLVVAGNSSYDYRYKRFIYELSKNNKNIIFVGVAQGKLLAELYSNCYIYVLPSEIEGMSISLLEAMSYGKVCLVSDIPENVETISGYGITFKNKDIYDLEDKLKGLLLHRDKRLGILAKEYVIENYTWDSIVTKLESFYKSVLYGGCLETN